MTQSDNVVPIKSAAKRATAGFAHYYEMATPNLLDFSRAYGLARGITLKSARSAGWRSLEYGPFGAATVIPYLDMSGELREDFGRLRNHGVVESDGPRFWQQAGSRAAFYFAPGINWRKLARATRETIGFTEGEPKALKAAQHGVPVIGLGGMWNFRMRVGEGDKAKAILLPDFDWFDWNDRRVELIPDSDAGRNSNVGLAVMQLGARLQELGAHVFIVLLPESDNDRKVGLDDYIHAEGAAAFETLRNEARPLDDPMFHKWGLPREKLSYTDNGAAERFVLEHGHRFRYVHQADRWLRYDDGRWQDDMDAKREEAVIETARALQHDATKLKDAAARKRGFDGACAIEATPRVQRVLGRVRTKPPVSTLPSEWDANASLLAVANGAVDLRTGALLPPDAARLTSRASPVEYDMTASAPPRFLAFLNEVMQGDAERVAYVRRVLGYCATGETSEHALFMAIGYGNNGKSTLLNVIEPLFGSYAANVQAESLMARDRHGGGANNDIARLAGVRFVRAVETNVGRPLDEALIKQLTGQDVVAARFLYGEWFEFRPQFKILLVANHLPRIHGGDAAIRRRIHVIPFAHKIAKPQRDFHQTFIKERAAILRWIVEGARQWYEIGLRPPAAVQNATNEYLGANDPILAFLDARCARTPQARVMRSELYTAYFNWARKESRGEVYPAKLVYEMLRERGFAEKKIKGERFFVGLLLKDDDKSRG